MSSLETGAAVLRRAAAMPISSAIGRPSGVDAWLGRRVGEFVLDDGTDSARSIQAYLPQDPAKFQYVSDLPNEAVLVARRAAVATRQSQAVLEDARTGAWHVAALVDERGAAIRIDELGALRQSWNDARFDTNHVDAGAVHGEAFDFPLRDDVRHAIDALDFEIPNPDLPAVATDSAHVALTAASRAEVSAAAPMQAPMLSPLPSHAVAPVAVFEQIDGIPGFLHKPLMTFRDKTAVLADIERTRATTGSLDDVRKLARRFSHELDGQRVAAFQVGDDTFLLAPLKTDSGHALMHDGVTKLFEQNPEVRFVTGSLGGFGSGVPRTTETHEALLDPARSARRLRQLLRTLDQPDTIVDKNRSAHAAVEAQVAEVTTALETAGFRERGALKRQLRALEVQRFSTKFKLQQSVDEAANNRARLKRELEQLTSVVERFQLPEREEWAMRGLREIASADAHASYDQLVRAARQDAFASDAAARAVLRANDGSLWTAILDATPDMVLDMHAASSRGFGATRPTEAIRAISVGGRTLQWDETGATVLAT